MKKIQDICIALAVAFAISIVVLLTLGIWTDDGRFFDQAVVNFLATVGATVGVGLSVFFEG